MQAVQPVRQFGIVYIGIIFGIVIIALIFILILKKNAPATVFYRGPFFLTKKASIVTGSDFKTDKEATRFLTAGEGTFQAFVYLDTLSKTGSYAACGTASNQPDCSTGLYGVCKCTGKADCGNCRHDGYKNVVALYGVYNLEILNIPDASRQNAVSTQLAIKTTASTSTGTNDVFVETIPLPALPMQKWVMITIAHDGRRIDVYYNDNLVSSSTLENTISTNTYDLTYVEAGDNSLSGTIALLRFYSSRLPTGQVASIYKSLVDTRGAPLDLSTDASQITAAITAPTAGSLLSRLCLDGSCASSGSFRAPSVTLPQVMDSVNNIYGSSSAMGSIASIYSLNSEYA